MRKYGLAIWYFVGQSFNYLNQKCMLLIKTADVELMKSSVDTMLQKRNDSIKKISCGPS